jgi:pyrimidine operon attenuation protein/uracil phosphoribosyltransferase
MPNSTIILDHKKIEQIITRIAFQIYEDNCKEQKIIVAGIANKGLVFARLLVGKLKSISKIEVVLVELHIDKKNPIDSEINFSISTSEFQNQVIILVDDVLNSGKTMMYGLQHFLKSPVKKLSTAVLVNRSYKRFPVHANYLGMNLSTTIKEHIEVSFEKGNYSAYLM